MHFYKHCLRHLDVMFVTLTCSVVTEHVVIKMKSQNIRLLNEMKLHISMKCLCAIESEIYDI